jgi:hypothetical protein
MVTKIMRWCSWLPLASKKGWGWGGKIDSGDQVERPNTGAELAEEDGCGEGGEVAVEAHQNGVIVEWLRSVRPFVLFLPTRTKGLKLLVLLLDDAVFVGLKLHLPCEVPLHGRPP